MYTLQQIFLGNFSKSVCEKQTIQLLFLVSVVQYIRPSLPAVWGEGQFGRGSSLPVPSDSLHCSVHMESAKKYSQEIMKLKVAQITKKWLPGPCS